MRNRWLIYQRERFPLALNVPLVAVFSYSALSYTALILHETHLPRAGAVCVGFVTSLLLFLQLRIADEFKDFDEDSRYRPYRPVPRGLVTLHQLAYVFVGAALVQFVLALWLYPPLTIWLLVVWSYLALMSREFFVRRWLKSHPFVYLWSHMLIMPLVDFYVTACNWMPGGSNRPPIALAWFLIISFFNGAVLEFGRKIRAPKDEEAGVETYTALWGRKLAVGGWICAMSLASVCAWQAAIVIRFLPVVLAVTIVLLLVAVLLSVNFLRAPTTKSARAIEVMSGLWTLSMYLSVGMAPRYLRG